jgi:hypothetical protein
MYGSSHRAATVAVTLFCLFLPSQSAPLPLPLSSRQLLNTLFLTYSPSTPSIYLSVPSLYDCPITPIYISGVFPPFALAAVSSPFSVNVTEQTAFEIGNLTGSGEGMWKPELREGSRFIVRVADAKGNVRYSEEKVIVAGDGKNCRCVLLPLSSPLTPLTFQPRTATFAPPPGKNSLPPFVVSSSS